ncbi:MAG: hypothetical protein EOP04_29655 [Proteobacteria bacterium]|nr:MAG: hypothetical protein EOP04_29655 [Pseudomonadota bacterium]
MRQFYKDPQSTLEVGFNITSYTTHFSLHFLKGRAEAVRENLVRALIPLPFHLGRFEHLDGPFVLRILGRRVRVDDQVASLLWEELNNTCDPTCKIVLPGILVESSLFREPVIQWCFEELEKQLSNNFTPEIGLDWPSLSRRPVVHALLEMTARAR